MKKTIGEKIFDVINTILLILVAALVLYPLIYVLSASVSSGRAYSQGRVLLYPVELTLSAYKHILTDSSIWRSYGNTIFYTAVGTATNLFLTFLCAYPLSKRYLPGGKAIMRILTMMMWVGAGMIPFYLTIKDYGLLNTRASVIFCSAISTYNMILMRNFFESVPTSLEEAAKIDGASDWLILARIFIPVSLPAIATIGLFYGVNRWNEYFWAMILLQDENKIPLQVLLKKLIVEEQARNAYDVVVYNENFSSETMIYATIVVAAAPVLVVYPFVQKYFVKGVMIGAVKG